MRWLGRWRRGADPVRRRRLQARRTSCPAKIEEPLRVKDFKDFTEHEGLTLIGT